MTTGFAHSALVAGSDDDLHTALVPLVRSSLAGGREVLLVVGERTRAALGGELPGKVRWESPTVYHQRLGFAYEGFRRILAGAGGRLHVVAEPDLLHDDRAAAYLAYEAICNETYAAYDCPVTCIWDSRHHPASVIDGVRATHAYELTAAGPVPSADYLPPERFLASHRVPMADPRESADRDLMLHEVGELGRLRGALSGWSTGHGFGPEAADDLVLAAVEVATNGLRHARSPVRVRAWRSGDTLVVQCDDAGTGDLPPAAGYHRPGPVGAAPGGRGLWLARQLADVVAVESGPGGTRVRLHFPHEATHLDVN